MKTNKSYSKRLRVTKKGKIIGRKAGQNHFNAKESAKTKQRKGRPFGIEMSANDRSRFLPGT
jgi:ribosomal protein L35